MEWTHLLAFNITLLAAIASPGPSFLYLMRTSMAHGRRAGLMAALGLGLMAALWTLAALLGLQVLFELFPWARSGLRIAGGAYLVYLAWRTWCSAAAPLAAAPTDRAGRRDARHFWGGLFINLGNPKSILFAGAVIVAIFPATLTGPEKALIFANHLAVEMVVQSTLAVLMSAQAVRRRYLASKSVFDRAAGAVMGALGLRLLLDRSPT